MQCVKRKRKGIMLAHTWDQKEDNLPELVFVQPKLNGVRALARIYHSDNLRYCEIVSSTGKEYVYEAISPIYTQLLSLFDELGVKEITLDGELYNHTLPFQVISGLARRKYSPLKEKKLLQFHIFDIQLDKPFYLRAFNLHHIQGILRKAPNKFPNLVVVPTKEVPREQVLAKMKEFVDEGYEGLMIRMIEGKYETKRSKNLLKIKPDKTAYLEISNVEPAISKNGEVYNRVGKFICTEVKTTEDTDHLPHRVNYPITHKIAPGRFSHYELEELYQNPPIGRTLQILYIGRTVGEQFVSARGVSILD